MVKCIRRRKSAVRIKAHIVFLWKETVVAPSFHRVRFPRDQLKHPQAVVLLRYGGYMQSNLVCLCHLSGVVKLLIIENAGGRVQLPQTIGG